MSLAFALPVVLAVVCPADPPVPDPNAYVRRLVGVPRQDEALSRYTYDVTETREDVDRQGRVEGRRSRGYQVFYVRGRPIRKLVARDARPLSPGEREKEERRARELTEAIVAGRAAREQFGVRLSRILERYDFQSSGREEVNGRCALVFDFRARPGDFAVERDFALKKLAGRVWVDEEEQAVARLDVHNTGSVRVALGIGASVSALAFRVEFRRMEPGVWLPGEVETSAEGRKLLFKGFHQRERVAFDNYRIFSVEIQEEVRP